MLLRAIDPGNTASYAVSADQSVLDALQFRVDSGVLNIESKKGFSTGQPVQVLVAVPRDQIFGIAKSGPGGLVVGPGFAPKSNLYVLAVGTGDISVPAINTPSLKIVAQGSGGIFAGGKLGYVEVCGRTK